MLTELPLVSLVTPTSNRANLAAGGHLRNANLARFARSITAAYRYDPGRLNLKAMATLIRAVVPHQLKQPLGHDSRHQRRPVNAR